MDMESIVRLPDGREVWGLGEEMRGVRSTNRQIQNSHGDGKYSIGNGVAKELICMTHGHEQWCGDCLRRGAGLRWAKGEKLGQL